MSKRLTPAQVGDRLGISAKRVYELIDSGKLNAIDVSTGDERPRWRIEETAVTAFEARRSRKFSRMQERADVSSR